MFCWFLLFIVLLRISKKEIALIFFFFFLVSSSPTLDWREKERDYNVELILLEEEEWNGEREK